MGYSFSYPGILCNISNEEAFHYCVHKIYPILKYTVLQEDDVRRIDLAEKLNEIVGDIKDEIKNISNGATIDYYAFLLEVYLKSFTETKKGSREEKYYQRALELIAGISNSEAAFNDVKDALMIFISLFRSHKNHLDKVDKYYATANLFDYLIEDGSLIVELYNRDNLYPARMIRKLKRNSSNVEDNAIKKFFYVNSIVILTYGLQERGAFSGEA